MVRVDVLPSLYRRVSAFSEGQVVWIKGTVKSGMEKPVIQAVEVMDIATFLAQRQALSADLCESVPWEGTV